MSLDLGGLVEQPVSNRISVAGASDESPIELDVILSEHVHALQYLADEVAAFLYDRRVLSNSLIGAIDCEEQRLVNIELQRAQHPHALLPSMDLVERERFLLKEQRRVEYVACWRDLLTAHAQWRVLQSSLAQLRKRARLLGP